jgi:hypothetical protein
MPMSLGPLALVLALGPATPTLAAVSSPRWYLSISDVAVFEESCAAHQAVFTVRLATWVQDLPPQVVTVQYATADGTAVGGVDYTPVSGTLSFAPPSQVLTVVVPITDALVPGPDKAFTLHLSNPTGAVLATSIGTATLHAPTVAKCASCGLSCDDGEACSHDFCDATAGCGHVDVNACAAAECALGDCGVDSDGDGLSDAWETNGYVDRNCNGVQDDGDLDLPGADPSRPDIYLQYDYMDGTATGGHSHEPAPAAIQAVVDAFDRQGIALHVEPGEALPHSAVVTFDPVVATCAGDDAVNFNRIKVTHFDPARRGVYHYAVFGHYNTCDSVVHCGICPGVQAFGTAGKAELPGNDFIVSFGSYVDNQGTSPGVETEAGTLMHELGHNLWLRHAGDDDLPDFKPNFLSVMNYNFVFTGIPVAAVHGSIEPQACGTAADCPPEAICSFYGTCVRIDFSSQHLPDLDELHLDENLGISAGSSDVTTYNCPDTSVRYGAGTGPIDWNCDEDPTDSDVAVDVNADGFVATLTGDADWARVNPVFQCTGNGSDGPSPEPARFSREPSIRSVLARQRLRSVSDRKD